MGKGQDLYYEDPPLAGWPQAAPMSEADVARSVLSELMGLWKGSDAQLQSMTPPGGPCAMGGAAGTLGGGPQQAQGAGADAPGGAGACGPWASSTLGGAARPACNWRWLSCLDGHIVAMHLACPSAPCLEPLLRGQLSALLPALPWLQSLDVSGNPLLQGPLPTWAGWSGVQALNLSHCFLGGPLPGEWQAMRELRMLDLTDNALTGTLPASLARLDKLQGLYLAYNQLQGDVPAMWGGGQLPSLRTLDVRGNCRLCGSTSSIPSLWVVLTMGSHVDTLCRLGDCAQSPPPHLLLAGIILGAASLMVVMASAIVLRRCRICPFRHRGPPLDELAVHGGGGPLPPRHGFDFGRRPVPRGAAGQAQSGGGAGPFRAIALYIADFDKDGDTTLGQKGRADVETGVQQVPSSDPVTVGAPSSVVQPQQAPQQQAAERRRADSAAADSAAASRRHGSSGSGASGASVYLPAVLAPSWLAEALRRALAESEARGTSGAAIGAAAGGQGAASAGDGRRAKAGDYGDSDLYGPFSPPPGAVILQPDCREVCLGRRMTSSLQEDMKSSGSGESLQGAAAGQDTLQDLEAATVTASSSNQCPDSGSRGTACCSDWGGGCGRGCSSGSGCSSDGRGAASRGCSMDGVCGESATAGSGRGHRSVELVLQAGSREAPGSGATAAAAADATAAAGSTDGEGLQGEGAAPPGAHHAAESPGSSPGLAPSLQEEPLGAPLALPARPDQGGGSGAGADGHAGC